jgi:hypothetical protein
MRLRQRQRLTIPAALALAATICALIIPASAGAAGPFKSVAVAGLSPTQMKITGGLDVPKRCRPGRTIRINGANVTSLFRNLPFLASALTTKSGDWARAVPVRDHFVLTLVAKRVRGKSCPGGMMLVEAGGPT